MKAAMLLILVACDGGGSPVVPDVKPIGQSDDECYGTGLVNICVARSHPRGHVVLAGTFDTTTSSRCFPGYPACVIRGSRITTGTLRVTGDVPLFLLADEWIHVQGDFDASSKRSGDRGPGANPASCGSPQDAFQQGGGAGGTYAGRGGNGGAGAGAAAQAASITAVAEPLGGCAGARGAGDGFTAPGAGGGAVFLIARAEIVIETSLNASGAGGAGAAMGGGAGGGSGGFIGLDAPAVRILGSVFANGGGGGEGGPTGAAGADPDVAGAAGGSGGAGGDGGAGGAGASTEGMPGESVAAGGGGGGGGAGIVMIIPPQATGGVVSPRS